MSVRSTRVLTKKPTRSSSALSVRPAIGLPIGMSLPAPSRVSRAASAACSTMNRLARPSRASASRPHGGPPTATAARCRRDSSTPPGAAGRSADRAGREAPRASRPERQLARDRAFRIALIAQHLALPQRVVGVLHRQRRQVGRLPVAPRRIGARQIARQRRQRPAVAGDVMHHQQQHVLARPEREQMRPQRQLAREIEAGPPLPPERPAGSPR